MSSRSGKSTPAKLVDSPDDIRRRRELAERKMRERHDVIKREHTDKIRKDLEDHARLQRELKEKEARELRRQQEIMQKNLERLNRDEERRKELLARNHAATSRTAVIKNVAFGSSTPRELSYLDRLPKSQKKLSPSPARDYDMKTPVKNPSSARRGLMVSSMYVPSPRSVKPSPKPTTPKNSNLMTQSVYSTRTTSSAGYTRTDRSTPTPKARLPRPSQVGSTASGKPPLPNSLKFSKRVLDTNTKSESVNSKSPIRQTPPSSKLNEETPNGKIRKSREEKKENVEPAPIESTPTGEQPVERITEELKSEKIFENDDMSQCPESTEVEPVIQTDEETKPIVEIVDESVIPDTAQEHVDNTVTEQIEEVTHIEENLNATSLEQEIANLSIVEKIEDPPADSLETELANIVFTQAIEEAAPEEVGLIVKDEDKNVEIGTIEETVKDASPEPLVEADLFEQSLVFPIVQGEAPVPSLAQELGENLFNPLQNELDDIKPIGNFAELPVSENTTNVAFNLNDTEYEAMDTAPAEPICSNLSSNEIDNVGNSSTEEIKPSVMDENNKDLTTNLLDLEEVSKSPAEQTVLSVVNQAFDIVQHTNPTDFIPINEHPTAIVNENDTKLSNSENDNDSSDLMDISVNESSLEKPEILPEADQVKISSLPPSPPIQQKSRENDDSNAEEPKKESFYKARIAEILSKTREQGPSPTEKNPVVETAVAPPATTVKFSPSTAAILQKLRESGRSSDNVSNLLTKTGSEPTLEDNPEDPRHEQDLLN
ncbi:unnamed protein product [Auanema sp. JU1783]|nr:unnamed protein product [Auanema sp. JU1783]